MSMISGGEASNWYRLLKEVLSDLRGATFKEKRERLARYKLLYEATRSSHVEYAKIFAGLKSDLLASRSDADVEKAKEKFLTARAESAGDRFVTKHDADGYLQLSEDTGERRFLASVVIYFCYPMDTHSYGGSLDHLDVMVWTALESNADKSWNSATSYLWHLVQSKGDKTEIMSVTDTVMSSTAERFAIVERTFSELDGNWRHGTALSTSAISELLENRTNKSQIEGTSA